MIQPRFAVLFLALAPACAPFPDLGRFGPETGPAPVLLPIDDLLAQAGGESPDPGPGLQARAAALKARAARIDSLSAAP